MHRVFEDLPPSGYCLSLTTFRIGMITELPIRVPKGGFTRITTPYWVSPPRLEVIPKAASGRVGHNVPEKKIWSKALFVR